MCNLVTRTLLICTGLGIVYGGAHSLLNAIDDTPHQCPNHTPVIGLESIYYPSNNTRVSLFLCRPAPAGPVSFQLAISSTYQTSLWRDKTTGCVNNTVISGLHALQRSGSRATPLGVTCSSIPSGYSLENCTWSRWLSQPRENFSIPELPQPWAVRSIINRHLQNKLDWRYKLELCQVKGSSPLYTHTNTCPVPSVPHGTVRAISHTHSITKSRAPFKLKMLLTCDSGYYWDNKTIAVCENGTWTKQPSCTVCTSIAYCAETVCTSSQDSQCLRCLPTLPDGLPLLLSKNGRRCRATPVITATTFMAGFVAGSNLTLDCEARGRPIPNLSWHRVLANGDRVPLLDHTHYIHHKNGSVTITNVTDMDSGPYACRAWNAAGSDIVYIDVYNSQPANPGPPSIYNWSPLVVSSPQDHTPTLLHCQAQGFPPPLIQWTYLNLTSSHLTSSHLPPSTFHSITSPTVTQYQNGTLGFQPVQTADTALYHCEATNLFGTVTMETILFVDSSATGGPYITDWSTNYTVPEGARLELTCSILSSYHHTNHLWMKKGGRVCIAGSRVWQNGNGSLVIEIALTEDEGPYWCVVWDEGGVAMEMTEVFVTNQPLLSSSVSLQNTPIFISLALLVTWVLCNMS